MNLLILTEENSKTYIDEVKNFRGEFFKDNFKFLN